MGSPCGSCKYRRFGGTSFIRVTRISELRTTLAVTSKHLVFLRSVRRLLVTATLVSSSPIFVTVMKEAQISSETSVLTGPTRRDSPEDDILHNHRRENLKSYIILYFIFVAQSLRNEYGHIFCN
jgi:hypothetical protein